MDPQARMTCEQLLEQDFVYVPGEEKEKEKERGERVPRGRYGQRAQGRSRVSYLLQRHCHKSRSSARLRFTVRDCFLTTSQGCETANCFFPRTISPVKLTVFNSQPVCDRDLVCSPHFIGFNGQSFDFHGHSGNTYCLLNDHDILINAAFAQAWETGGRGAIV